MESDDGDESSDKSDGGGSGSDFTFDSLFLHYRVEIGSDRVGISLIFLRSSSFVFCSTIRVVVSRIKSSLSSIFSRSIFSRSILPRSIFSRSNVLNLSKSIFLTNCLTFWVSLICVRSS